MTKEKIVIGMKSNGYNIKAKPITLRVTVDARGQSLSLSDDEKVLLIIPLEAVKDIIVPVGSWERK